MRKRLPYAVPVLAFAAFLPALWAGFVDWDDKIFVVRNDRLLLSAAGLKWMFTTTYLGLYQPLSWLSSAVDKAIWGEQAFGFHLTNLLLHAFNAGLVLLLGRRLLKDERQALAAALLFALHPLRAEAVAWVTGRKDLLATSFYLLTVLLYVEGRLKAACACFAAGLMTKASGVGLPVVLWLLDRSLRRSGPFFALSLIFGLAGAFAGQQFSRGYGWLERLGLAAYGATFYIRKTLWPSGLGPIYEIPVPFSDLWPMAVGSALLLLGLAAAAWRWKGLRIPLAAYLALVLPTLGLVQFGKHLAADRYSYLACLPLAFLAAKVRRVVWVLPVLFALSWAQTTIPSSASWSRTCCPAGATRSWPRGTAPRAGSCSSKKGPTWPCSTLTCRTWTAWN